MIIIDDDGVMHDVIPKDQYEQRLKADMVAMLTEIQLEIDEIHIPKDVKTVEGTFACCDLLVRVDEVIQEKIDKLKAESEAKE